jgi:drug/metabolite transporter (DMT)-like permease
MRTIAEECFALVREYKGSHSGEHGDGIVRSEFNETMFGSRIARAFETVKDAFDPAGLVVLFAAMMFAVQLTTTKRLTGSNTVLNILFWMNVMQLPMYLITASLTGRPPLIFPYLTAATLPGVVILCIAGLSAHLCVTNAFRHGDAIVVVPIDFMRIPLITVVGVLLYGEAFDPLVMLGAIVTAAGIVWNIRQEARERRR